jgi:hypothetical protein
VTLRAADGLQENANWAEEPEVHYAFYPEVIEARGQVLAAVIGNRLCDAAIAKLKSPEGIRGTSYKDMRKLMRTSCADQEGYLLPQAPVLETVLRMLLTTPADKLSLSTLHGQLTDLWMTSPWPRHIAIESLQRVLDNARHYGICQAG